MPTKIRLILMMIVASASVSAQTAKVCSSSTSTKSETVHFAFRNNVLMVVCVRDEKSSQLSNQDICAQEMFLQVSQSTISNSTRQIYQSSSGVPVQVIMRGSNPSEVAVQSPITSVSVSGKRQIVVPAGTFQVTCK